MAWPAAWGIVVAEDTIWPRPDGAPGAVGLSGGSAGGWGALGTDGSASSAGSGGAAGRVGYAGGLGCCCGGGAGAGAVAGWGAGFWNATFTVSTAPGASGRLDLPTTDVTLAAPICDASQLALVASREHTAALMELTR